MPYNGRTKVPTTVPDSLSDSMRTLIVTIPDHRKDYARFSLREEDVDPDPIRQFERWFDERRRMPDPRDQRHDSGHLHG